MIGSVVTGVIHRVKKTSEIVAQKILPNHGKVILNIPPSGDMASQSQQQLTRLSRTANPGHPCLSIAWLITSLLLCTPLKSRNLFPAVTYWPSQHLRHSGAADTLKPHWFSMRVAIIAVPVDYGVHQLMYMWIPFKCYLPISLDPINWCWCIMQWSGQFAWPQVLYI